MDQTCRNIWSRTFARLIVAPECANGDEGKPGRRHRWRTTAFTAALVVIGASGIAGKASAQSVNIDGDYVVTGGAGGTQPNPWTVEDSAYVGRDSEGSITIENGGAAHFEERLTVGSGSTGTVTVSGDGSELTGDRNLWIGLDSDGTLTIENGAIVEFGGYVNFGYVGSSSGLATVTVDGDGSSLSTLYGINVESNYSPSSNNNYTPHPDHITTFDITSGATVMSKDADIGTSSESFAVVTISGNGSTWTASQQFMIGDFGTGVLNILDGAVVMSDQDAGSFGSHVGTNNGGHGEVLVDGAGSKWVSGKFLKIGRTGTGILTVANGGTIITEDGNGTVFLGDESVNAVGILNIGAAAGDDAVAPGTLQAGKIQFGLGDGRVVFNHTRPGNPYYDFATPLIGAGTVQHIAGRTNLTGDNSGFIGAVEMEGGELYLENAFGDDNGGDNGSSFIVSGGNLHIGLSSEVSTAAIEVGADGAFTMMGWSTLNVTGSDGITNAGTMELADVNSAGTVTNLEGGRINIGGISTLNAAEIINEGRTVVLSHSISPTVFGGRSDDTFVNRGSGVLRIGNSWLSVTGTLENSSSGNQADGEAGIDIGTFGDLRVGETFDNAAGGVVVNRGELRAKAFVNQAGATLTTSNLMSVSGGEGLTNQGTVNASGELFGKMSNQGGGVFNVTGDLDSYDPLISAPFTNEGNAVLNVAGGNFTGVRNLTNTSAAQAGIYVAEERTLSVDNPLNNFGGIVNNGIIEGGMKNEGAVTNAGTLDGGLVNDAGTFTNTGVVNDGVTINGGTFITHAAGQTTGIVNNGELVFNQLANGGYAGLIIGTGTLEKRGDGTLELTADNSAFSGATTVSEGKLVINTALGGTLTLAGGVLGGNGLLDTLNIAAGGILAPGNSVGTTNAVNYNFAPGSTYEIELNDGGNVAGVNNDLVNATGTVTINGAAAHVKPENGTDTGATYTPGTTYTVVTTTGGVTGTFVNLTDDFAFLNFALSYDANNVYLTSQLANMCLSDFSANQCAVADSLSGLGSGALFNAVTNLSNAEVTGAMDQLSGEAHPSILASLMEESRYIRDAAIDRLRSLFGGVGARVVSTPEAENNSASRNTSSIEYWGQLLGAFGRAAGESGKASADRSSGGIFAGADVPVSNNIRAGIVGGYGHTHVSVDDLASSASSQNWSAGVYSGGAWGPLNVRAGGAYTWNDLETRRRIGFTGFSDNPSGDANAATAQGFAESAYRIRTPWANYEPYAALAHVQLNRGKFTEQGGAAALTAASSRMDTTFTTLGLRAETFTAFGTNTNIRLSGGIGWRHAFGDTVAQAKMAFVGGTPFAVTGVPIAQDALVVELGADGALGETTNFGVHYLGQISDDADDHSFSASLAVTF
ncbi:autotransporter domain-containing protein [Filomicrobium sp.]|uniref:autotransporter domain-containing protein n=1 Tax=Filomicrobium sp. TaxID=2024831 RepID=UPI002588FC1A|nr:autotransporter domain-containing protein [Filomicrobium sp.]MCV0371805.1 autotransporter domain-containing protein [Filomicrobium sp.]